MKKLIRLTMLVSLFFIFTVSCSGDDGGVPNNNNNQTDGGSAGETN